MEEKMRKIVKIKERNEKRERSLGENEVKVSKRELFLKSMRELGKSEDILIRENGRKIKI